MPPMLTNEGNSAQYALDGDITCKVLAEGKEIEFSELLVSMETVCAFGKIATAKLTFQDNSDTLEATDSNMLSIGSKIEIRIGKDKDECIFKGLVTNRGLRFGKEGAILLVTAKHDAFHMTQSSKFRVFEKMSDSDVISQICSEYSISADVESTQVVHEKLVQYNGTDWDFINMRAEASGLLLYTKPDGIYAKKPDLSADPILTVESSLSLNKAELSVNGRNMFPGINAGAWNFSSQELDEADVKTGTCDTKQGRQGSAQLADAMGNENIPMTFLSGQISPDAMQMMAEGHAMRSDLSRITGSIDVRGFAGIFPGDIVELKGLGKDLDGLAFAGTVVQEYSSSDWNTTLGLGLSNIPFHERFSDVGQKPADGSAPAAMGLQIGKVEAVEGDPQGEERIRVRLLGSSDAVLWARIALSDAGKDRGIVFMPEIDDEVVLGFLAGNPAEAVILGMLHSSAMSSPIKKSDDNNVKGIVTRSGIKVEFDDDKTIMTFSTPGGNKVTLSDDEKGIILEDKNGSKITMNSDGVTVESSKDIMLKAKGDMKVEGVNIELNANAQMVAKGSGSAEVSSSGNTVIKGSIVQIN